MAGQELYSSIPQAQNFTLAELCRSDTAYRLGISNLPTAEHQNNLVYLAQKVLQPIRDHFAEPVIVSSGYRSPALNKAVKGSASSFHCFGCAADWDFRDHSKHTLVQAIYYIHENLPFTELIAEHFPHGWIHIAIAKGRENERQLKYCLASDNVVRRVANIDQLLAIVGGAI